LYSAVSKDMFDPAKYDVIIDNKLKETLGSPSNFNEIKNKVFTTLSKDYTVGGTKLLNIYNMNGLYNKIDVTRTLVNKQTKSKKEELANKLKATVAEKLGFEPTVRKLIEVFTTAIEVFMETIYTVSTAAERPDNLPRTAQLQAKFGTDIVNSDIKKPNLEKLDFFAWPDYRERDETTKTYVNKYLGEPGVLDRPQDVDELIFIEDLLNAFLRAQEVINDVVQDMEEGETTWYPINPIDTSIYLETEPYSRAELLTSNDVVRLMLIRGMTFLGYTNDSATLDKAEIETMALAEANAILRGVTNDTVKLAISNLDIKEIKKTQGVINGVSRDVVKKKTATISGQAKPATYYFYNYIFQGGENPETFKLIPISGDFNNASWGKVGQDSESSINLSTLQKRKEETEDLFLTNYSSAFGPSVNGAVPTTYYPKYLDGGTYVEILTVDEYNTTRQLYPIEGLKNDIIPLKQSILNSEILLPSQVKEAGFNVFAGPHGIQEFSKIVDINGVESPLMFIFYGNKKPGLAYTRAASGGKKSIFDLASNPKKIPANNQPINYDDVNSPFHKKWGNNRELLIESLTSTSKLTYPFVMLSHGWVPGDKDEPDNVRYSDQDGIILFGSPLYYNQTSEYAKAMLFLHTLPFVTMGVDQNSEYNPGEFKEGWNSTIYYIRHLFDIRGGFVQAPRLWCAYVGSILWRLSTAEPETINGQQIGGGSGVNDPIKWRKNVEKNTNKILYFENIPTKYQHITGMINGAGGGGVNVRNVDISKGDLLRTLPLQVRNEFKKIFFEFVNGNGDFITWDSIKDGLEIWNGNGSSFETLLNSSYSDLSQINNLKNKDKYDVIIPQFIYGEGSGFRLELKGGYDSNESVKRIIDSLVQQVVIVNNNFNIWRGPLDESYGVKGDWKGNLRDGIYADENSVFDVYFNTIIKHLTDNSALSPTNDKKELEQQIFGSTNEDVIKFQLYRTCKNIHDKWLAGTTDPKNIIFQCGVNRSRVDSAAAIKFGSSATPRLIDSFRFISRSFRDIGDLLYINPLPVNKYLLENPNTSAYDSISQLLNDNNFDFIALPTFINFRDAAEVEAIFTPFGNHEQAMLSGTCGPSFVCAYVGQKSQHLAYANSDYPNDGFDLRCIHNENGVNLDPSIPDDFKTDSEAHEDPVGAFVVRYSQQNQNIFKDINLDQSEFTETDESLQIQDDISQKGSNTNRTIAGQNLYNVYAVRSYTAEVEMMGNAMIQPMMYFQLDNIPMFHGAYMITRVKHSIKPNHMSTNFTGVRIRYAETPLVTAMDLYMSFVDDLGLSEGNGAGGGSISGSFQPIVATLIDNGVTNGYMELGKTIGSITNKTVDLSGTKFTNVAGENGFMITEGANAFKKMLTELTTWIDGKVSSGVLKGKKQGDKIIYGQASSFYRPYSVQKSIEGSRNTAKAGTSYHGWGIAVDWTWVDKNGKLFVRNYRGKGGSPASDFDFKNDPILEWLYNNSYRFGFINPKWARNGGNYDEVWHWEYHGKTAKCLMEGSETIFNQKIDLTKPYDAIVINPKTPDGKESVYTGCAYRTIEKGDGGENALKTEVGCPSIEKAMSVQQSYKSSIVKLLNGTYKCGANRDCDASIEGFKKVTGFFTNGALNKKGVIGLTQALLEGFGTAPNRRNPGNLRGDGGFAVYGTWKEGWTRYLDDKLIRWADGNPVATKSASYVKCYDGESNEIFKKTGVKYKENIEYNYTQGQSMTLRQYTNVYAPWGDNNNPTNYCAAIAITLKDYGYDINVDDKMDTWL